MVKINRKFIGYTGLVALLSVNTFLSYGQNKSVQKTDSTKITLEEVQKERASDRNVMLNAAGNTGPRTINIGLPAGAGGTSIVENGLPVVYLMWPELPTKVWRQDALINSLSLYDLGTTAINFGEVGYTAVTTNNLGTEKMMTTVSLMSNHYGLLRGSLGVSAPVNDKGLMYAISAYGNLDPGTYDVPFQKYFVDRTQMFKGALTQKYKYNGGSGKISVFYKYIKSGGLLTQMAPFKYTLDGKVKEVNNLEIGRTNFLESSGRVQSKNPFTGEIEDRDAIRDYPSESHTIDIIGSNKFDNGLYMNYTLRYHKALTGLWIQGLGAPTRVSDNGSNFTYLGTNTPYTGDYTVTSWTTTARTPLKVWAGVFELGKKGAKHDWKVGFMNQYYGLDDYEYRNTVFDMSVEKNPSKLVGSVLAPYTDKYGNYSYNPAVEFNTGHENRMALFFGNLWRPLSVLSINYGGRAEWKILNGHWAPKEARTNNGTLLRDKLAKIDNNYFTVAAYANAIWKISRTFGALGEFGFTQLAPQLENYGGSELPLAKKSSVPSAGLGIYFNHPNISLVSKATYIKRDNYVARPREENPIASNDPNVIKQMTQTAHYNIKTMGWTTDVVGNYNGFGLHFLLTIQSPKYEKYNGLKYEFGDGKVYTPDYSDNTVAGVSKVLMEIDPSYEFALRKDQGKIKIWASARYFSKQYINLANSLYFAPRWETFAGVKYTKGFNWDLNLTVVNPLNERGASGSIDAINLLSKEQINEKYKDGTVLCGTYIRPFTVELSATYRFFAK